MKLLTLNAHSLVCDDGEYAAKHLAEAILSEKIDLIALQEANQPQNAQEINTNAPIPTKLPVKNGNFVKKVMENLKASSQSYNGLWYGFKESYGCFEEGVGIITRFPITGRKTVLLSSGRERTLWKRRCALGINTPFGDFFSAHMGWWSDIDEPFMPQWERMKEAVDSKKTWILGDFNGESHKMGETYDAVTGDGFFDSFVLAGMRDEGYTVRDKIDGWDSEKNRRIDYIFCNFPAKVEYSRTIFNGENYNTISDHFGVLVKVEM